jgi:hypothetical protein
VREHFSPKEAARVGAVLMFTLFGMALGGWMSGRIFDLTGSYAAAFVNGIAWNGLTSRSPRRCYGAPAARASPSASDLTPHAAGIPVRYRQEQREQQPERPLNTRIFRPIT